ncbi:MAG TPA: hypothetical protein VFF31_31515 [Blastocatellia bacterium]|nr:hypothetical protein [Blastocatellia bacterium]
MFPDDELYKLKERISQMSDWELRQIVEVEYGDYRPEALEFAEAELRKRRVAFDKPEAEDEDSAEPGVDVPCENCGGAMRSGLLFSEKELTILFPDDNEERFVQALACVECGQIRLVADLETDVEG